jgi:hypothetical protein
MRAAVLLTLLAASCASLPDNGALQCNSDRARACPDGYFCAANERCYRIGQGPDLDMGTMIGCSSSANCPAIAPVCSPTQQCSACGTQGTSSECATTHPATPLCGPDGACVECLSKDDCAPQHLTCLVATHVCGQCSTHSDCTSGICNVGRCEDIATCTTTPSSGSFCVAGVINKLVDTTPITDAVYVSLFDAAALVQNNPPIAVNVFSGGTYIFPNVTAPGSGTVTVVTGDADRLNTTYVNTATNATVSAGNMYRVDAYATPRTVTDSWKSSGGFDFTVGGGYIARFFNDPKPSPFAFIANETHPVTGVQLTKNAATLAGTKYFNSSLSDLGGGLSATSAFGSAIVASTGTIGTFSGTGGSITWEQQPGISIGGTAAVVFVARFHPQ